MPARAGSKQEIRYGEDFFRLRIRDDGKGIDAAVLNEGGRAGHWGLSGMRELAKRIGAKLDLCSEPGAGTKIELTVPARVAYGKASRGFRLRFFRRQA